VRQEVRQITAVADLISGALRPDAVLLHRVQFGLRAGCWRRKCLTRASVRLGTSAACDAGRGRSSISDR
jgi:hypothetical protein